MIRAGAAGLLLLVTGTQDAIPATPTVTTSQLTIRQRIVIRVPEGERRVVPAGSSLVRWRESNGPRCVSARQIVGASLMGQSSVDLILRDNRRVRARLGQRCAGLDYYQGFYVNATEDGNICADRDVIRSRMGGNCGIVAFRQLQPVINHPPR